MRATMALAASLSAMMCPAPLMAQDVAIRSAVYVETKVEGATRIVPAATFVPGDRVVTIMRWEASSAGNYTVTTALPPRLNIQSASSYGLQVSSDDGRSWRALANPDAVPRGVTHLRWRASGGEGQVSYRAIVR